MSWLRRVTALALLVGFGWLLAKGSAADVSWHGADAAAVRLSWVARPERIEQCRDLSPEEIAARPAHMRLARECSGASATYRLALSVDGVAHDDRVLQGGGLRNDRAIFVLDEFAVAPGARRIEVRFARVEPSEVPMDSSNIRRGAVPRSLTLDTLVAIPSSGVALVSLVDGRLQLRTP